MQPIRWSSLSFPSRVPLRGGRSSVITAILTIQLGEQ